MLASVRDVDPNNPWVMDKSGRHTNVAALFDWPLDDSDDSDAENSSVSLPQAGKAPVLNIFSGADSVRGVGRRLEKRQFLSGGQSIGRSWPQACKAENPEADGAMIQGRTGR